MSIYDFMALPYMLSFMLINLIVQKAACKRKRPSYNHVPSSVFAYRYDFSGSHLIKLLPGRSRSLRPKCHRRLSYKSGGGDPAS